MTTAILPWLLAALVAAVPGLYFILRGKLDDWRSLAEYAVRYERRGEEAAAACPYFSFEAYTLKDRADRCEAAIPRILRSRLLKRARARVST